MATEEHIDFPFPQDHPLHPIPEGNDHLAELSKKGYNYLKEGVLDEAEKAFNQIIELDDTNNYALVGLGDVSRKKGDQRTAMELYQKCLSIYPGNNYALFGLADCYKASNQFARALEIWEEYLKADDRNITVLTRVADAYRKVRNFARSKETYFKVLAIEENNPYALIGLGHLHYDFKDYREALRFWEKVYLSDPVHADVRVLTSLGNCHRKLKTYYEGLPYFQKVLETEGSNFYALFGMADCYRGMNQMGKSLEYWNKILEKDPNNKVILTRAGDALRQLGRLDEAEDSYRKALNIEFDIYAVLGLALIHKEKGRYSEAVSSLSGILKNDPNNPRLYIEIAECQVKLGRRDEAMATLGLFQRRGIKNHQVNEMLNRMR